MSEQGEAASCGDVSDAASVSSLATSRRSKQSVQTAKGSVQTVNGVVFFRVTTCPCCGLKNTDENITKRGPWGPEFSQYMVWFRGTSTSPDGKYCKVGVLTWQHGGFADEHPRCDDFMKSLKDPANTELATSFSAAKKGDGDDA